MAAACISAVIALAVVFSNPATQAAAQEGFTLDEVLSGKFYARGFNGTWLSDTEFTYMSAQGGINIFNVATGVVTDVLGADVVGQLGIGSYKFSPDRNYILYSFDSKPLWRYSSFARYAIIDLVNKKLYPLQPQFRTRSLRDPQLMLRYASWNKQGNGIFYVYDNDIYYRPTPDSTADVRITTTGSPDTFFNGIPDWVYEEEVLSTDHAMWMSNSGDKMFFASFDDRQVEPIDYSVYGEPGNLQSQYPFTVSIRYPKPGRNNPLVSLWIVDTAQVPVNATVSVRQIPAPAAMPKKDHYFTAASWVTDTELMIIWVNRHQNVSIFSFCNSNNLTTCDSSISFTEPNGWVDFYTTPKFSADGRKFLVILPVSQGAQQGNYKHLVLYDRNTKVATPLSNGLFEVTEILGWDETRNIAYFMGTAEGKPAVRHMYSVNTVSSPTVNCLTCGSVNVESKNCTYNSIEFSTDLRYFVHGCDGPSVPRSVIKDTATQQEVFLVNNNLELLDRLSQKAIPRALNMEVPVGDFKAQVRLILPPSLNRNKASKYPLLVYVYGGPQSQQVSDRFRIDWGTHLASSRGVIYALIDGRGSGYQGDKMLQQIYRKMGTVEIEDQIAVTKYLADSLPFVDANRTAIWGWSYGGFAAASALARDSGNVFKCAMSVAPVTNWVYYDSIYTERYMGLPTPEDNELSYKNSDLTQLADNFRNKRFYLLHGTADDNVHYQQSMMLGRSLEAADILFRQQSYTDENHSIGHLKKHLYHSLGAFLMSDCFELENEIWG